MSRPALALVAALVACSSKSGEPRPAEQPPPADAAIDGITALGSYDPASGAHLDDDPAARPATRPPPRRQGRPIEIMLRSTPTGAKAFVDGVLVGVTPTFWAGETGAEHEFTFSLPKHALARYRFWPITTGTLHARLEPVAHDVDAGVPPPELMQPAPSIAPPETLVTPPPRPDAAVAPQTPTTLPSQTPTPAVDASVPFVPAPDAEAAPAPGLGPTP